MCSYARREVLALQETTQWLWLSMLGKLEIHLLSINGPRGIQEWHK